MSVYDRGSTCAPLTSRFHALSAGTGRRPFNDEPPPVAVSGCSGGAFCSSGSLVELHASKAENSAAPTAWFRSEIRMASPCHQTARQTVRNVTVQCLLLHPGELPVNTQPAPRDTRQKRLRPNPVDHRIRREPIDEKVAKRGAEAGFPLRPRNRLTNRIGQV